VPAPRVEQIKKTKTIPRVYMCDNEGVYRRLRHRKKMQAGNLSRIFFAALASTNAGRRNYQEKKDDPSLAIRKNIHK
jgi:hypothetical protein